VLEALPTTTTTAVSSAKRFQRGFTLIELMIVVVIVSILMGVAGPAFYSIIKENELRTQASRVVSSLNLVRSTAVKRNESVSICASENATSLAVPTCSGTWMDGWVVYFNDDPDGTAGPDNTPESGEIVRGFDGLPDGYIIKNAELNITYYPDGTSTVTTGTGPDAIHMCPPDKDSRKGWSIEISITGRARMFRSPSGACS
jgi:type IV fimbrial biogenesis protein FimT